MSRVRDERGAVAIELIGYVFVVVLVALLCVQGLWISQAGSAAQAAARDGARAAVSGRSAYVAVHDQVPDWLRVHDVVASSSATATRVTVTVEVEIGLPGMRLDTVTLTRDATMPRE